MINKRGIDVQAGRDVKVKGARGWVALVQQTPGHKVQVVLSGWNGLITSVHDIDDVEDNGERTTDDVQEGLRVLAELRETARTDPDGILGEYAARVLGTWKD